MSSDSTLGKEKRGAFVTKANNIKNNNSETDKVPVIKNKNSETDKVPVIKNIDSETDKVPVITNESESKNAEAYAASVNTGNLADFRIPEQPPHRKRPSIPNKKQKAKNKAFTKKLIDKKIKDITDNNSGVDEVYTASASEWSNDKFRNTAIKHNPGLSKKSPILGSRCIRQVRKIASKVSKEVDRNLTSQEIPSSSGVNSEKISSSSGENPEKEQYGTVGNSFSLKDTTEIREINGVSYFVLKESTYDMIDPKAKISKTMNKLDMCSNPAHTNVFHISWDGGLSDEGLICEKHAKNIMEHTNEWRAIKSKRGYMTASSQCVSEKALVMKLHIFGKQIQVKFQIMQGGQVFPTMVGQQIMGKLGIDQLNSIQCMAFGNRTENMCQYSNMPAIDCVVIDKKIVSISHDAVQHRAMKSTCLLTQGQQREHGLFNENKDDKKSC